MTSEASNPPQPRLTGQPISPLPGAPLLNPPRSAALAISQIANDRLQGTVKQQTVIQQADLAFAQLKRQPFPGLFRHFDPGAVHEDVLPRRPDNGSQLGPEFFVHILVKLHPAPHSQVIHLLEVRLVILTQRYRLGFRRDWLYFRSDRNTRRFGYLSRSFNRLPRQGLGRGFPTS